MSEDTEQYKLSVEEALAILAVASERGSYVEQRAVVTLAAWRNRQYEYVKGKTKHIWIDGPDGGSYHCVVCGISRASDHSQYDTCESWIIRQAENILNGGSAVSANAYQWKAYLREVEARLARTAVGVPPIPVIDLSKLAADSLKMTLRYREETKTPLINYYFSGRGLEYSPMEAVAVIKTLFYGLLAAEKEYGDLTLNQFLAEVFQNGERSDNRQQA